ncbi:alkaline phosphatase family protein [Rubrobacter tropicus]|uniref:Alkaline phosphatase family protein n=1 Tax=Rubrobacter tropicus TaxID=2653851 RepID=A0A6G8QEW9_9ACTN|nr:alkaline phosphatase D family protein [Rubrobacter tropicus]QIN84787.1 alkaline phosphatase family protein [Rubrobacter tropicus]
MNPKLILGPLLRYAGDTDATIWVETQTPCEVEVTADGAAHRSPTFAVEGHHYALVRVTGLQPASLYEYSVSVDGETVWPETNSDFPASTIKTTGSDGEMVLAYGSCRVAVPHEPPYTLERGIVKRGGLDDQSFERDALFALAHEMMGSPRAGWPDALLMLGDQIYADEPSPGTMDFIRSRRDPDHPPGVADFEEYTRLYRDAWGDPTIRWLLSTLPSAMIFDDHDVHDDWNASKTWVETMRAKPWWEERIVGAFSSYWVYQHLGNLSPQELEDDELFNRVGEADDATRILREFAYRADREVGGTRWSFHRDFGRVRLIVADSRAGRILTPGKRSMLDEREWEWLREKATGDFDHLLFGTSMPFLLSPGFHHLEAASEAICDGALGRRAAKVGEFLRQNVDLEHWPAFNASFRDLASLLRSVAAGERSEDGAPATTVVLSGDVHHGYLARATFGDGAHNPVYQAVGSPLRNPLGVPERLFMRAGWSSPVERFGRWLARLSGVTDPPVSWRLVHEKPWFRNHVSTIRLRGRNAVLKVERTTPEDAESPHLEELLEHRLA